MDTKDKIGSKNITDLQTAFENMEESKYEKLLGESCGMGFEVMSLLSEDTELDKLMTKLYEAEDKIF